METFCIAWPLSLWRCLFCICYNDTLLLLLLLLLLEMCTSRYHENFFVRIGTASCPPPLPFSAITIQRRHVIALVAQAVRSTPPGLHCTTSSWTISLKRSKTRVEKDLELLRFAAVLDGRTDALVRIAKAFRPQNLLNIVKADRTSRCWLLGWR